MYISFITDYLGIMSNTEPETITPLQQQLSPENKKRAREYKEIEDLYEQSDKPSDEQSDNVFDHNEYKRARLQHQIRSSILYNQEDINNMTNDQLRNFKSSLDKQFEHFRLMNRLILYYTELLNNIRGEFLNSNAINEEKLDRYLTIAHNQIVSDIALMTEEALIDALSRL